MIRETYNPIRSSQPYENHFYSKLPALPPLGFTIVLTCGQGGTGNAGASVLITDKQTPSKRKILEGKYNWQTLVDMRPYSISFEEELLSVDSFYKFRLALYMTAQVEKPDQTVANHVVDVAVCVQNALLPKLRDMANDCGMERIGQLRKDILVWLENGKQLNTGIRITDISLQLQPDQRYIDKQAAIQKLRDKKEYEAVRAQIAGELSELYGDPGRQVYAELASGHITPEEAAERLSSRNAADFDEARRRAAAFLEIWKEAQDSGAVSPETMDRKSEQLFSILLDQIAPGRPGEPPILEDRARERRLFAPPED